MNDIQIIKANGQRVPFDEGKVRSSAKRAGIPDSLQDEVVGHVRDILYEDIPTGEIYRHIIEFLGKSPKPFSRSRYSLKQSIMDLGPTGFPFEKFIASVMREYGYVTDIDVIMRGLCVSHEVDVLAKKNGQNTMVECKFHNKPGTRTDVKVALYVYARFQDIMSGWMDRDNVTPLRNVWLVTNTKCSQDAIAYAKCVGIKIVSWGYPQDGNLQNMIEEKGLHPVTCLTSLSNYQKKLLLDRGVVLCRDLLKDKSIMNLIKVKGEDQKILVSEIEGL